MEHSSLLNLNQNNYNNKKRTSNNFPKAQKISISIVVISLPVLYVSLLHLSPSAFFKDTTFWFLLSNCIIIILAADSGIFASSSTPEARDDLYEEYIRHSSRARSSCSAPAEPQPPTITREISPILDSVPVQTITINATQKDDSSDENKSTEVKTEETQEKQILLKEEPEYQRSWSEVGEKKRTGSKRNGLVRRSSTMVAEKRSCGMEESEYWKMSNEELNRRADEFIRRFNREIRMQERILSAAVC